MIIFRIEYMEETTDSAGFWKRLDEILASSNLTSHELSQKTGINHQTLSQARKRNACLSLSNTLKVAHCLHTTVEYLVLGKGEAPEYDLEECFQMIRKSGPATEVTKLLPFLTSGECRGLLTILGPVVKDRKDGKFEIIEIKDSDDPYSRM